MVYDQDFDYFRDRTWPSFEGKADFGERRLAIRMIGDAYDQIKRYASGDRLRLGIMQDAIAWAKGETQSVVTLEIACEIIGWNTGTIRRLMLRGLDSGPDSGVPSKPELMGDSTREGPLVGF